MAKVTDMTVGNPTKLLITFALPMLFGNLFQQLYSMVDTLVVGQGVGVQGLSAVGSAGWLDWFFLGNIMGLMQGFMILIAQRFGAGDEKGLRKSVTMSFYLALATIVFFTSVALLSARPILVALNTPAETLDWAHLYISVIFLGIPVIVAYNLFAAILRALGDSRTPLIAIIIASVLNIGLDVLFVIGFRWGVAGAAIATVTAQFFSAIFCLVSLVRLPILKMTKEDWKIDWSVCGQLMKLGTPMMMNSMVISLGGLVVQYIVNGFGYVFVASITAAQRICGLMEQAGASFATAIGTFAGQNFGAEKFDRIRLGVRKAMQVSLGTAWAIGGLVIIFGKFILRLFVSDTPEMVTLVVDTAYPYLIIMCCCLWVLYALFVYRTTLQGIGDTFIPLMSGFVELLLRIVIVLTFTMFLGEFGVYIAEVSAWIGAELLLMLAYYWRMNKICPKHKYTAAEVIAEDKE